MHCPSSLEGHPVICFYLPVLFPLIIRKFGTSLGGEPAVVLFRPSEPLRADIATRASSWERRTSP